MTTHAQISVQMLKVASGFLKSLALSNENLKDNLEKKSRAFVEVADLLAQSPMGSTSKMTHVLMAKQLLLDSADLFEAIGEQNEILKEQMTFNAEVYRELAYYVEQSPEQEADDS